MSETRKACAHVRQPECEALKALSPGAAKLWIAIRYGRDDTQPFEAGIRDYETWGISKDQAARGFKKLFEAGLLEEVRAASFHGKKRTRRLVRIVHSKLAEEQSHGRDNAGPGSRKSATVVSLQSRRRDYGKPLQSHKRDIPKEPPSPSAQEAEGEGGAAGARPPMGGAPPPGHRQTLKDGLERIDRQAERLGLSSASFTAKAGGPSRAASIAEALETGAMTLAAARRTLFGQDAADPPEGPTSLPFVGIVSAA